MIRGTTPTHTFTIPFNTSNIQKVKILYCQNDELILRKKTQDCTLDGNTISVRLTQEDTFKFNCKANVHIQVRILTERGDSLVSKEIVASVGKCLEDEVLA